MQHVAASREAALASDKLILMSHYQGLDRGKSWDCFARQCQASYQCSYAYIRPRRIFHKVSFLEFFREGIKIGQCAVAVPRFGSGPRLFLDTVQLLPAERHLWPVVLRKALGFLGPGTYRYGSAWATAGSCGELLTTVEGVAVHTVEPFVVQAVDFSK